MADYPATSGDDTFTGTRGVHDTFFFNFTYTTETEWYKSGKIPEGWTPTGVTKPAGRSGIELEQAEFKSLDASGFDVITNFRITSMNANAKAQPEQDKLVLGGISQDDISFVSSVDTDGDGLLDDSLFTFSSGSTLALQNFTGWADLDAGIESGHLLIG